MSIGVLMKNDDYYADLAKLAKDKNVMIIFHHKGPNKINYLWKTDKTPWKQQMKQWRTAVCENRMNFMKGNCGEHDINGSKVYSLIFQSHNESGDLVSNTCPLAFQLSVIVDGCMYLFRNEKYRNTVYDYLMKNIDEDRFD